MMRAATLFNFLIEAMLTGSVMILLLLVVRRLLRRQLGNRLICLAWLLVAVRLLLPLSFPNPMMNELRPTYSDNLGVRPIADQVRVRSHDALSGLAEAMEMCAAHRRQEPCLNARPKAPTDIPRAMWRCSMAGPPCACWPLSPCATRPFCAA